MDLNYPQSKYHGLNQTPPCYIVNITSEHGIWQSENPWTQALPLMIIQLTVLIALHQFIYFLLKPLHVPRLASDTLASMLLGKTALYNLHYIKMVFPIRGILILETMGYWALCLHLFLVGLSTDISAVFRTERKANIFAACTLGIPFVMGAGIYFFTQYSAEKVSGCFFYGAAFAVTGFPVVARVLADLRIIHSEVGRMALSASLVNDLASWVLLTILLPSQIDFLSTLVSVALTLCFTAFCFFVIRPAIAFLIRKTSKDNTYSEAYLNFILASISLFACASDALGTSPMVGAFVYGLVMPSRDLAGKLLEAFEDFINEYLLPLYFATVGLRVDMPWDARIVVVMAVAILACTVKVVGSLVGAFLCGMSHKEGLALGVALNGKSILVLVILSMGYDVTAKLKPGINTESAMSSEAYTGAVVAVIAMSMVMPFVLGKLYQPTKRLSNYQGRTIQKARKDSEFRIMACFQGPRNVSGIINLLDSSNATKESPLVVSGLNLFELTGRNSSMLIVHSTGSSSSSAHTQRNPHIEQIITALDTYSSLNEGLVSVHSMTLLSPYANMHEDICSLVEDKQSTLIVLPFHKMPAPHGPGLEDFDDGVHFRAVNLNVLQNAPCTVAIFVDKGFGTSSNGESNLATRKIALIFVGGPDDREALAYASRMAGTQGVRLTVIRILPGDNLEEYEPVDLPAGDAHRLLTSITYVDRQRRMDDESINEFRLKWTGEPSVSFVEKMVNNEEETVTVLKETEGAYDLYLVGKGEGIISPLTAGLMDWCEFNELGAVGDLLVTSSFAQRCSVLVIQQYAGAGDLAHLLMANREDNSSSDRSASSRMSDRFGTWDRRSTIAGEEDEGEGSGVEMAPFAKHGKKGKDDGEALEKGY